MNAEWRRFLETRTGIELSDTASRVLQRLVAARCRDLGIATDVEYRARLADSAGEELERLIDALTVTHTWFFRDYEQLSAVGAILQSESRRPVHVWTAGCATGEETYTIALLSESLGVEARVLGTDLNSRAVAAARTGVFNSLSLRALPDAFRSRFEELPGRRFRLDRGLREGVTFEVHNLLTDPPKGPPGGWDVILCRNVLIYFTPSHVALTIERLASALRPGGTLVLGASDILFEVPACVTPEIVADRIVFRRPTAPAVARSARPPPTAHARAPEPRAAPPLVERASLIPERAPESPPPAAPSSPASPLSEAHRLFSNGDVRAARSAYERVCEDDPLAADALLYAGLASYFEGDLRSALHRLRGCLLLDADCWPASYYLAACYEGLGLAPEAQREYRHAARLCRDVPASPLDEPTSPLCDFRRDLEWLVQSRAGAGS